MGKNGSTPFSVAKLINRKSLQLLIKKSLQDTAATQLENKGFYAQF